MGTSCEICKNLHHTKISRYIYGTTRIIVDGFTVDGFTIDMVSLVCITTVRDPLPILPLCNVMYFDGASIDGGYCSLMMTYMTEAAVLPVETIMCGKYTH